MDARLIALLALVVSGGALLYKTLEMRQSDRLPPMRVLAVRLTLGEYADRVSAVGWALYFVMLVLLAGQLLLPVDPQDEGQYLTYPRLILDGWMPYRDIWMTYPPASYLLVAGLLKLGIPGIVAARLPGFLLRAFFPVLVSRVVTRSWRRFSWVAVPLTFGVMFGASSIMAYPWICAMPFFFGGLVAIRNRPVLAGLLFVVAGLFRFELALAGLLGLGSYAALLAIGSKPWKQYALGAAALVVIFGAASAICTWVTAGYAFKDVVLDQLGPVQHGRSMALWPPTFGPLGVPLAIVAFLAPFLMIAAAVRLNRPYILATNLAALCGLTHYLSRAERAHLYGAAVVTVPWLIVCLCELWRDRQSFRAPAVRLFPARVLAWALLPLSLWNLVVVGGYAAYVSPLSPLVGSTGVSDLSAREVSARGVTIIDRDTAEAADDRAVIRYLDLHASPGDAVFIGPSRLAVPNTRTDLYALLPVRPATRFLEIQPGLESQAAVQRQIIRELEHCTWVVLLHGGQFYSTATGTMRLPHPVLDAYIRSEYHVVMRNGTYEILRRNGAAAPGVATRT